MIERSALETLEEAVVTALSSGDASRLDVIGWGEISIVIRAAGTDGPVACKRLPAMNEATFDAYRSTLATYVSALAERSIAVAPTDVVAVGESPLSPYLVQPLYPQLVPGALRRARTGDVAKMADRLAAVVVAAAGPLIGFDAQAANWAIDGDALVYLDISTPLIRDPMTGLQRLDTDLFLASLPWALRPAVRRFALPEILSHYHDPRAVLVDMIGNLHKERLTDAIPRFLEAANRHVTPPITAGEVHRYYRSDARMWAVLQHLRRADRWWQRRIRRRMYPFLLPGPVDR